MGVHEGRCRQVDGVTPLDSLFLGQSQIWGSVKGRSEPSCRTQEEFRNLSVQRVLRNGSSTSVRKTSARKTSVTGHLPDSHVSSILYALSHSAFI